MKSAPRTPAAPDVGLSVDAMLHKATAAFDEGYLKFAVAATRAITSRAPERVDGWILLVRVLAADAQIEAAEAALAAAEHLHPDEPGLAIVRARLRARQGRDRDVIAICDEVRARQASTEATLLTGNALRRMGQPEAALLTLRSVPVQPAVACGIATALLDLDRPAEAIETLAPFIGNARLPVATRYALHHVTGEAYEKLGEYPRAMEAYAASKRSWAINFSERAFRTQLALVRDAFSADAIRAAARPTIRTDRPVFIASMPRSGTTLLDRIIAAHPLAGGAGETRALRGQVSEWKSDDPGQSWPRNVLRFATEDLDRVARRYLDETQRFGPKALRIADKNLHNWLMLGLVAVALPQARVIHLRRDPMDIGISCFERLEPRTVPWSTDLPSIALAIKGTESLMAHWKRVTDLPILEVQYEDLVRHHETEVRRILAFLELPFDAACLQHHLARTSHTAGDALIPPPTLGSEQASRPLNDRSIGRAKRFGSLLDPLRAALDASP